MCLSSICPSTTYIRTGLLELGGCHLVFGLAREVTERKEAEEIQIQRAKELAVLGERNRMTREIHDTLAQGFTGIILQLEAADKGAESRAYPLGQRDQAAAGGGEPQHTPLVG